MLQLLDHSLPTAVFNRLQKYQQEINSIPEYEQRVRQAEAKFAARNRASNRTFQVVRATLTEMCSGTQRCVYCEDSAAIEIDHHKPKSLYPEEVFVWENYVYACGGCNKPKSAQTAVFSASTGALVEVTRSAQSPIVPPEAGDIVLIDPRHENPLTFLRLDLLNTFFYLPIGQPETKQFQRGRYTIDVLQLNTRSYLPRARKQAYRGYVSHLHRYLRWRERAEFTERLHEPMHAIKNEQHPTVWAEMKRQRMLIPELEALFAEAPEALNW